MDIYFIKMLEPNTFLATMEELGMELSIDGYTVQEIEVISLFLIEKLLCYKELTSFQKRQIMS